LNNSKSYSIVFGILFFSVLLAASAMFFYGIFEYLSSHFENDSKAVISDSVITVIIDAGHGGEDAGAVAPDGTLEKALNLEIATIIDSILAISGVDTVMTRETDTMLSDDSISAKRKTADLRCRYMISKQHPNSLFVSIHMNKFPIEKYSGLQVYYSPNDSGSEKLASMIQSSAVNYIQPHNTREIKKADSSIYLLDRIETPAVLVECGFLSNESECAMLNDASYRRKLSAAVYAAVLEYIYPLKSE